ncbi:MAG TPA: hypothetical protein PK689_05115 [Kiritimatiellia bacterium]|nr:hypothetical protein [Kiritimatiellia bacterium]
MMINALFYAALVRLLIATDKPFLCSSLYAFLILAMGFLSVQAGQATYRHLLLSTAIGFAVSSTIFVLLSKTDGTVWWTVVIIGAVVILFII